MLQAQGRVLEAPSFIFSPAQGERWVMSIFLKTRLYSRFVTMYCVLQHCVSVCFWQFGKKQTLTLHQVGPCPCLNGKAVAELRPVPNETIIRKTSGKRPRSVYSPSAKISQRQATAIKLSGLIAINIRTVVH